MNRGVNIIEWKQLQKMGESIDFEEKIKPEDEGHLITACEYSEDGRSLVVGDKDGRVVIFSNKSEIGCQSKKSKKMVYTYEYNALEKDFNVLTSLEYRPTIRDLKVLKSESNDENLNILTAGYRKITLDSVFVKFKKKFETNTGNLEKIGETLQIPKIKKVKKRRCHKNKTEFAFAHENGIKNLSVNSLNKENFISCDKEKIFLWDINYNKTAYNIIDLKEEEEKIRVAKYSQTNSSLIAFGTDKGEVKICDLRISSEVLQNSQNFFNKRERKMNLSSPFVNIHDISFNDNSNFTFATRQSFTVDLWDFRVNTKPVKRIVLYEPFLNNYSTLKSSVSGDIFKLQSSSSGSHLVTGGYNNMFHILDIKNSFNCQIVIDDNDAALSNQNVFRKVNSKGCCSYKEDNKLKINLNRKLPIMAYSPTVDSVFIGSYNCLYEYKGTKITV